MWLYVVLLGPEIWSPGRDKCRYGEEPAVAQEDKTQDILHGYCLRGVQGRGRESAAGQYGPDLQKNVFILNKTQSMCKLRVLFS